MRLIFRNPIHNVMQRANNMVLCTSKSVTRVDIILHNPSTEEDEAGEIMTSRKA
jgi:hypothetical protein